MSKCMMCGEPCPKTGSTVIKNDKDTLLEEILTDVLNNYCSVHDAKVKIEQKIRTAVLDEVVALFDTMEGEDIYRFIKAIDNLRGGK